MSTAPHQLKVEASFLSRYIGWQQTLDDGRIAYLSIPVPLSQGDAEAILAMLELTKKQLYRIGAIEVPETEIPCPAK